MSPFVLTTPRESRARTRATFVLWLNVLLSSTDSVPCFLGVIIVFLVSDLVKNSSRSSLAIYSIMSNNSATDNPILDTNAADNACPNQSAIPTTLFPPIRYCGAESDFEGLFWGVFLGDPDL